MTTVDDFQAGQELASSLDTDTLEAFVFQFITAYRHHDYPAMEVLAAGKLHWLAHMIWILDKEIREISFLSNDQDAIDDYIDANPYRFPWEAQLPPSEERLERLIAKDLAKDFYDLLNFEDIPQDRALFAEWYQALGIFKQEAVERRLRLWYRLYETTTGTPNPRLALIKDWFAWIEDMEEPHE